MYIGLQFYYGTFHFILGCFVASMLNRVKKTSPILETLHVRDKLMTDNDSKNYFPVPVVHGNDIPQLNLMNGKETLWIDRGWRPTDDKDSGLLETKLLNNHHGLSHDLSSNTTDYAEVDSRNLTTFYNCRKEPDIPAPYATTTLINSLPRRDNIVSSHS